MNLDRADHIVPREDFYSLIEKMRSECMTHDYLCEKYIHNLTSNIDKWYNNIVKSYKLYGCT